MVVCMSRRICIDLYRELTRLRHNCHKDDDAAASKADLLRFTSGYEDRILPLDRTGAEWAAQFRVQAQHSGLTLNLGDALIAGTAKAHDLAVATRNVRDFEGLGVDVVNQWDPP